MKIEKDRSAYKVLSAVGLGGEFSVPLVRLLDGYHDAFFDLGCIYFVHAHQLRAIIFLEICFYGRNDSSFLLVR